MACIFRLARRDFANPGGNRRIPATLPEARSILPRETPEILACGEKKRSGPVKINSRLSKIGENYRYRENFRRIMEQPVWSQKGLISMEKTRLD